MRHKLIYFIVYVILGGVVEYISGIIHSTYLCDIYKTPFLAVIITLTVFSFTLFSYISGKVSEIEKEYKFSFQNVRTELKDSFRLLTICDIIIIILLILKFSDMTYNSVGNFAITSALNTMFLCIIHIMIDLGKSIFELFETIGRINSGNIDR